MHCKAALWQSQRRYVRVDCLQRRYHSGRKSFRIWAAVEWDYKSELIFVDCNGRESEMTMKDYQDQILEEYGRTKPTDRDYILMEDGNRAHGMHNPGIKRHKEDIGIHFLDNWPPDHLHVVIGMAAGTFPFCQHIISELGQYCSSPSGARGGLKGHPTILRTGHGALVSSGDDRKGGTVVPSGTIWFIVRKCI